MFRRSSGIAKALLESRDRNQRLIIVLLFSAGIHFVFALIFLKWTGQGELNHDLTPRSKEIMNLEIRTAEASGVGHRAANKRAAKAPAEKITLREILPRFQDENFAGA